MSNTTPTPTLCQECLGIIFDDIAGDAYGAPTSATPFKRIDTYPDLPALSASANASCTFCQYLCFLIREKLPPRLSSALKPATNRRITIELASPAYVRRSEVSDYSPDLVPEVGNHEADGLYWLELVLTSPAWPGMWRARAMVYQHEGNGKLRQSPGQHLLTAARGRIRFKLAGNLPTDTRQRCA